MLNPDTVLILLVIMIIILLYYTYNLYRDAVDLLKVENSQSPKSN